MIIVNLKGGVGNQMFQYALGRKLSIKNNDTLKLDIDGLDRANKVGDIYRPFALDVFNINKTIATPEETRAIKYPYGIISKGWRWFSFKILRRFNILFDPSILDRTGNIYLDGFWQSPNYFNDIRELLLKEFTLVSPLSPQANVFSNKISEDQAVSIHIRRGDYVKDLRNVRDYGICSTEYYKKAMSYIETTMDSPTYFVFSDDIEWVKINLPIGENAVFVKGDEITDTEEMVLMSMCKHNIIANSTFSWWGAWLNQNPDKIVVAPVPWFETQPYDKDLISNSWVQIQK